MGPAPRIPLVTCRGNAGRTVIEDEIIERPDDVRLGFELAFEGVDARVEVRRLLTLAGIHCSEEQHPELVRLTKACSDKPMDELIQHKGCQLAETPNKRVDTPRLMAVEGVVRPANDGEEPVAHCRAEPRASAESLPGTTTKPSSSKRASRFSMGALVPSTLASGVPCGQRSF